VQDTSRFVRSPSAPVAANSAPRAEGTHLVQLGSFASEQGARRAWGIYVQRYPDLAGHQMVVSEAVVRGKRYWRVSAGGFGSQTSTAMCGRVRASGQGCFAYAEGRPLPGAVDTGVRMARR
jgi:cell division septation protein DedD